MNAKLKIKNAKVRMKGALFVLTFAFLIFNFAFPIPATTTTSACRLAVFDDVWETVHDRYYDPTFHGIDWEGARKQFRPMATEARNAAELYAVLRRMLGTLSDPHTRVFAPEERFDWRHPRFISVGINVREIGNAPVVVAVERGSKAERAGLRVGDVVTSIDGEAALAVFSRRLNQAGSSTSAFARLQAMAKLFEGERGSTLNISWIGTDSREHQAALKREMSERDTALHVERVRDGVGVVEFNVFAQSIAVDFNDALDGKLRGARGLVIDLRQNGGGDAEAMAEIASVFLPAGKSLGRFTDRSGRTQFEPYTRTAMLFAPDSIKSFRGGVVILTSERTSSAAEIFIAAMKESRRAIVIGQTTCGCVLAISRRHTLPDGGELDVSEMDYQTADGLRLEGVGVTPDEKITLNLQDLRARRDRAMEQAVEYLMKLDR
jgi:carboxyl-terminal processing protease